ncbi:hypothetical protein [Mucilaginibacter aquatilis]|uniref:DUF4492 domain-containing protein n=1 Tax=Mucilaginibacter aquatilis TaxID=1517760 RepID=A0A6I4I909_9SPHI|nr:hypothetical protein [Mucilaginibacter aquatilis]MVN89936.1 hypothetical protein [Mucilaginibacter aquatilis]
MKTWLKRLGVAGFLFFLIKGLIWLAIFFFGFKACNKEQTKKTGKLSRPASDVITSYSARV